MNTKYKVRTECRPLGLEGISEDQIAQHWSLYEGYVKNVNALNERLSALSEKKEFGLEFDELKRRLGFEYNGMILHERYFGILKPGYRPLGDDAELTKLLKTFFGGFNNWKDDFQAVAKMRGVGWVIMYFDPRDRILTNHWISGHEAGHPSGFEPILVLDLWEHAYMVDHGVSGKGDYVKAFLANVDWPGLELIMTALRSGVEAHTFR